MTATAYERKIADRFVEFVSKRDGEKCKLIPADDPPDFLLMIGEKTTWLELTDIYLSNEEAKFLSRREEKVFTFECGVDQLALRLFQKLDQKLSKLSYGRAAAEFGKGTLLLTCQHSALGEVDLAHVQEGIVNFVPSNDQNFFNVAYFEYWNPDGPRAYMPVYPSPNMLWTK